MRRRAVNDVGIHHKEDSEFISAILCYTWRNKIKRLVTFQVVFWFRIWQTVFVFDQQPTDMRKLIVKVIGVSQTQHLNTAVVKTTSLNSYELQFIFIEHQIQCIESTDG